MTFMRTGRPKWLPLSSPKATVLRLRSSTSLTLPPSMPASMPSLLTEEALTSLSTMQVSPKNPRRKFFKDSGPEDWLPTINLNVFGSMNMVRRSLPAMIEQGWGRIIQISSGAGSVGLPIGVSSYGASKAAAESLIRHVAVENGKYGITANALALGLMANVADFASEQLDRMLASCACPQVRKTRRSRSCCRLAVVRGWRLHNWSGHPLERWIHLRTVERGLNKESSSAPLGIRTRNLRIKSPLLCR